MKDLIKLQLIYFLQHSLIDIAQQLQLDPAYSKEDAVSELLKITAELDLHKPIE